MFWSVTMGIISTIILVVCVIVCLLVVLLVLLQNEEGDGMGSLLGGSSTSAFGARSASALSKLTRGAVAVFFILVLALALLNRSRNTGFEEEVKQQQQQQSTEWWKTDASSIENKGDADTGATESSSEGTTSSETDSENKGGN